LTHDLIWRKSRGLVGEVLVNKKQKKEKKYHDLTSETGQTAVVLATTKYIMYTYCEKSSL